MGRRKSNRQWNVAAECEEDSCIIVDSTRRGKSMPDALSKTVPIWCAVLNRLLFQNMPWSHALRTSAQAVGRSEHAQIEARLDSFVEDTKVSKGRHNPFLVWD